MTKNLALGLCVVFLGITLATAQDVEVAATIAFTEGPTADPVSGDIFFTDQANNRIMRLAANGKLSTYRQPANYANGLVFDSNWNLLACESGDVAGGTEIQTANGLAISPDDKVFYVVEANPADKGARLIRAYDLRVDGTVINMRVFHNFYPGRSGDGMSIDVKGNLYVAAGLHRLRGTSETLDTKPGIHVFAPSGELLKFARQFFN